MVWALFFISLTSGVLIAHSFEMSANRRTMDTRYRRVDVAKTIATSGLTEANAFLRRRPTQPVVEFAPQLDPAADPPINETLDPDVGLVREFEVRGNLWGRYEVRKEEALDVSANYGESAGTVWDVGARGYLYERIDSHRRFDEPPNRVVGKQALRTEMRGLPVEVPGGSAIVVLDPSQVQMLGDATIDGATQPAISYLKPALPLPLPILDISITGSPVAVSIDNLSIDVEDVFRLREEQVRYLSDVVLSNPRQLFGRVVTDQAVFAPGDLMLAANTGSLRGRMLLFVKGDFAAASGNNSDFSGVLYVTGNAVIEGPFQFRGTMIVAGYLKAGGSTDMVSITYDPGEVQKLRDALGRYRISHDLRPSISTGAFSTLQALSTRSGCCK